MPPTLKNPNRAELCESIRVDELFVIVTEVHGAGFVYPVMFTTLTAASKVRRSLRARWGAARRRIMPASVVMPLNLDRFPDEVADLDDATGEVDPYFATNLTVVEGPRCNTCAMQETIKHVRSCLNTPAGIKQALRLVLLRHACSVRFATENEIFQAVIFENNPLTGEPYTSAAFAINLPACPLSVDDLCDLRTR